MTFATRRLYPEVILHGSWMREGKGDRGIYTYIFPLKQTNKKPNNITQAKYSDLTEKLGNIHAFW